MKRRLLSFAFSLFLCLGFFSVTAQADGTDHTDHTGWTELTAEILAASGDSYELTDGSYYLSGTWDEGYSQTRISGSTTLTVTGNVTLCLSTTTYWYEGTGPVIRVEKGADLTICTCSEDEYYSDCQIYGNSTLQGGHVIDNYGTLTITGGYFTIGSDESIAVYNAGTLNVTGGIISGGPSATIDWFGNTHKPGYGIYNEDGGEISLAGSPSIIGTSISTSETGSIPANAISTADPISASYGDEQLGGFYGIQIYYRGDAGAVVTNVTGTESDYENGNWFLFSLCYPENSQFIYNETAGTLSYAGHSSLSFCGYPVMDGIYYTVEKKPDSGEAAGLSETDENNYDIFWDEDSKILTLNSAELKSDGSEAMFDADCENLSVRLIGKNALTGTEQYPDAYILRNTGGNITLEESEGGSLALNLDVTEGDSSNRDGILAGIAASGSVVNHTELTINGIRTASDPCPNMTAVSCSGFNNIGTITASMTGAVNIRMIDSSGDFTNSGDITAVLAGTNSYAVLSPGIFENHGKINIDINESSVGEGIDISEGSAFSNTGSISIDIEADDTASGIIGYSRPDASTWENSAESVIEISITSGGGPVGALGGSSASGIYLTSSGSISFSNNGTMDVTVDNTGKPASDLPDNWPTWQYFNTIGIGIMPNGAGNFTNTGSISVSALKGYSAGLALLGGSENLHISNRGDMDITAAAAGDETARAIGIFAQIPNISGSTVKELALNLDGGKMHIRTFPAEGFESAVPAENLMAVCLSQRFISGGTASEEDLQQIHMAETALTPDGEPVVIGPSLMYDGYNAYINTIGMQNESGNIVPLTEFSSLPKITGTVSTEGTLQVGSTLTANVSGLPEGLAVNYQWQSGAQADGPFTDIPGADSRTYTLTDNEAGKYIRVIVTPTGSEYGGTLIATSEKVVSDLSSQGKDPADNQSAGSGIPNTGDSATFPAVIALLLSAGMIVICRRSRKMF